MNYIYISDLYLHILYKQYFSKYTLITLAHGSNKIDALEKLPLNLSKVTPNTLWNHATCQCVSLATCSHNIHVAKSPVGCMHRRFVVVWALTSKPRNSICIDFFPCSISKETNPADQLQYGNLS